MNRYLLTLVLKSELSETDRKGLLDGIKSKAIGKDGRITKEDLWGNRELAYPIKKQTKGYYAHFDVETDPAVVKHLDKTLKVEEDILRYLFIRNDIKKSKVRKTKKVEVVEEK